MPAVQQYVITLIDILMGINLVSTDMPCHPRLNAFSANCSKVNFASCKPQMMSVNLRWRKNISSTFGYGFNNPRLDRVSTTQTCLVLKPAAPLFRPLKPHLLLQKVIQLSC
jgi:hypothetical protein